MKAPGADRVSIVSGVLRKRWREVEPGGTKIADLFSKDFLADLAMLERLWLIAKSRQGGRGAMGVGARRSRRMGDGLEFADHRDYAPGDDIRFIDWPYYARMEKLLLRLFHEHSESDVVISLDCSASMAADEGERGGGKFDYARRVAAALAYVVMGSLDRVTVVPFGGSGGGDSPGRMLRTGRNRRRIFTVLDYLAGLGAGGQTHLKASMRQLAGRLEEIKTFDSPTTIVLISDLLDCGSELSEALDRLRAGGAFGKFERDVTVLHLYSRRDAKGELEGPYVLTCAETERRMQMHVTEEVRQCYRRQWARFRDGCRRTCLSRGATYVSACTDVPVATFMRNILVALRKAGQLSG